MVYTDDKFQFIDNRKNFWISYAKDYGVSKLSEITALKEYEATHDSLTGLYIRRGITENTLQGLKVVERYKRTTDFENVCVVLDLKGLKKANDQLGYDKGDELIAKAAKLLKKSALRPLDLVGRIGGDEFVLVLIDTSLKDAQVVLDRIKKYSEEEKVYFHVAYVTFISLEKIDSVITKAANMMEEAKKALKKDETGRTIADSTTVTKYE